MTDIYTDQTYLRNTQYRDASNLNARIALHERFSTNTYDWRLWVFDQFTFPRSARLLEIGCGPGHLWQRNLHRIPKGWKIILSDFSPGMLDEAWRALHAYDKNFQFEVIDAQSIPYPDGYFDGVIANHMLYHVPNRTKALAEISRVLEPGGKLYAATNGEKHMVELDQLILRFNRPLGEILLAHNQRQFTLENGAEQLAPYFDHIELRPYEDSLNITEAAPLVAYILSMVNIKTLQLEQEQVDALENLIRQELAQKGAIHIQKSVGLFIAEKKYLS